jgi:hypothetical protein
LANFIIHQGGETVTSYFILWVLKIIIFRRDTKDSSIIWPLRNQWSKSFANRTHDAKNSLGQQWFLDFLNLVIFFYFECLARQEAELKRMVDFL